MKFASTSILAGVFGTAACARDFENYKTYGEPLEGEQGIPLTLEIYVYGLDLKMDVFWCINWLSKEDQWKYANWLFDQIKEHCPEEPPVPPGPRQNQVDDPAFVVANEAWAAKANLEGCKDPYEVCCFQLGRMVKIMMTLDESGEDETKVKRDIKIKQLEELVKLTRGDGTLS